MVAAVSRAYSVGCGQTMGEACGWGAGGRRRRQPRPPPLQPATASANGAPRLEAATLRSAKHFLGWSSYVGPHGSRPHAAAATNPPALARRRAGGQRAAPQGPRTRRQPEWPGWSHARGAHSSPPGAPGAPAAAAMWWRACLPACLGWVQSMPCKLPGRPAPCTRGLRASAHPGSRAPLHLWSGRRPPKAPAPSRRAMPMHQRHACVRLFACLLTRHVERVW